MTWETKKKIGGPKISFALINSLGIACIIKLKALCHCKLFNLCMAENVHSAVADVTLEL